MKLLWNLHGHIAMKIRHFRPTTKKQHEQSGESCHTHLGSYILICVRVWEAFFSFGDFLRYNSYMTSGFLYWITTSVSFRLNPFQNSMRRFSFQSWYQKAFSAHSLKWIGWWKNQACWCLAFWFRWLGRHSSEWKGWKIWPKKVIALYTVASWFHYVSQTQRVLIRIAS